MRGRESLHPATAEEKANPPLTLEETRAILGQGIVSGVAEHCGLDWRGRSFLPMMTYFRQHEFKSERQMALIGGVHGIMQGQVVGVLAAEGSAPTNCGNRRSSGSGRSSWIGICNWIPPGRGTSSLW